MSWAQLTPGGIKTGGFNLQQPSQQPQGYNPYATGIDNNYQPIYGPSPQLGQIGSDPDRAYLLGGTEGRIEAPPMYAPDGGYSLTGGSGGQSQTGQLDEAAYQNFQNQFNSLFPGANVSSEDLLANADKLRAMGMEVQTNASGRAGKVKLPNGDIIDVVGGGEHGANIKQWGYGPGSPMSTGNWAAGPIEGVGPPTNTPGSLGGMMGGMDIGARAGALEKTPGYQFTLDQGMKALEGSAAAKGTLLSGGFAKDALGYATGLAQNTFDDEYRRLFGIAGLGQGAAGNIGQYGSSYAANSTDLLTGAGNARAAGTIGGANATNNFLGQAGQTATDLYMYDQWNKNRQPAGAATMPGAVGQYYPAGTFTP